MRNSTRQHTLIHVKEFIERCELTEATLELPLIEKDLFPVCMASVNPSVHEEYSIINSKSGKSNHE